MTFGDAESEWSNVISGVPQGSVLGPIIFVLYINDLPGIITSPVKIFADDTISFTDTSRMKKTKNKLSKMTSALSKWSDEKLLGFNATKCKRMHIVIST